MFSVTAREVQELFRAPNHVLLNKGMEDLSVTLGKMFSQRSALPVFFVRNAWRLILLTTCVDGVS